MPVLAYGLTLVGMNLLIYQAFVRLSLGVAMALEFTGPLAVSLATSRKSADFVWVALTVAGLALLLPVPGLTDSLDPVGAAFALAAGACWAAYIVVGQRVGRSLPAGQVTALGMAVAAAVALPIGAAAAGSALLSWAILPAALGVAVLSSVIPYTLEMAALKRLPATTFGVLMSLEPALGAAAGVAVLGLHLAPAQWAAIGCVVLAAAGSAATAHNPWPSPEVID
jgi:inner membrane transporter RhtA